MSLRQPVCVFLVAINKSSQDQSFYMLMLLMKGMWSNVEYVGTCIILLAHFDSGLEFIYFVN